MKPTSRFLEAARALDEAFDNLEQTAGQLGRLELNTEASLDKARHLLERFASRSETLGQLLTQLGVTLSERQAAVQAAVEEVNQVAPRVQARLEAARDKMERFGALGVAMRELTAEARSLGPDEVARRLRSLTERALELQEEARRDKMPGLERGVQSLRKTLKSVTAQLESAL